MSDNDPIKRLEQEMAENNPVYGSHEEVAEALNGIMMAVASFGNKAFRALSDYVNEKVPLLNEIEVASRTEPDLDLVERYFGSPEAEARTVDAMADGVRVAQEWIQAFMAEHNLDTFTVLVPTVGGPGARTWSFGRMSTLRADGRMDGPVNLVGSRPMAPPAPPPPRPPAPPAPPSAPDPDGLQDWLGGGS